MSCDMLVLVVHAVGCLKPYGGSGSHACDPSRLSWPCVF
jgi:hypothetical protein